MSFFVAVPGVRGGSLATRWIREQEAVRISRCGCPAHPRGHPGEKSVPSTERRKRDRILLRTLEFTRFCNRFPDQLFGGPLFGPPEGFVVPGVRPHPRGVLHTRVRWGGTSAVPSNRACRVSFDRAGHGRGCLGAAILLHGHLFVDWFFVERKKKSSPSLPPPPPSPPPLAVGGALPRSPTRTKNSSCSSFSLPRPCRRPAPR